MDNKTIALFCLIAFSFHKQTARADDELQFNRNIRPILSENCFQCHGPDEEARQADLRLDVRDVAVDAGALVAGNPSESELWVRISSDDPDTVMPPPSSKKQLTTAERATVKRWISAGAAYQPHWSFLAPARSKVPAVKNNAWLRNEIDNFILVNLERHGLTPALEAGRERIIRRVTFDLTGIPPTLEEIDAFLNDRDEGAYERLVDCLLRSERVGERLASDWLDVARYSDTYGYQVDRDRHVWPWRDWVIRAFNRNLPFDQFLTDQLAGDLLPAATEEQILATTFNRLHPQKVEGGSTPEEFRIEYVADRTQTFATAMLGLTLECCRCHDHKFDSISQREYYQLTAFFDKIDEFGLYSYFTSSVPTPTLLMPNEKQQNEMRRLEKTVATSEENLIDSSELFEKWLQSDRGELTKQEALVSGRIAHLDFETVSAANVAVDGVVGKAARLSGDDAIGVGVGNFHRSEPFSVAFWMNTPDLKERAVVFHRSRAWTDAGSRGYQLLLENGRLSFSLIHFWPGNAIRIRAKRVLPLGEWQHVAISYDGSSRADGLQMWVNGRREDCATVRDNLSKEIRGGGGDKIAIGERFRDRGFSGGSVDEFKVFSRQLSAIEVRQLHDGESLVIALETPAAKLSKEDESRLLEYYLLAIDVPSMTRRKELQQQRQKSFDYINRIQEIMVMREMSKPRQTFLLKRGAYDARGDSVEAMTPSALPPYPASAPRNRLGLAKWLTSVDHPLTARLVVNRYWQLVMGEGIVRSPEDFGSQGQPPTHPQLLDWLAVDFVENDWDLKRLLKKIVMSATYRQDSIPSGDSRLRDPLNLQWSRAMRHRYSAEMLRDNVLAVSGLLVHRIGGPPAKPYEVEASFKPTKKDSGDGLYRRSVYTYWKRTAPAPVMMALDASKRDVCRVKRERTTSPLQVLVMLNGPQFVEAARVLSKRTMAEDSTLDGRLRLLFRRLTSRQPGEAELSVLRELWEKEREHLRDNAESIRGILVLGNDAKTDDPVRLDHATLTMVASALMNYDECIVRR